MSDMADVLAEHQFRYADRCCACEGIFYDTRELHSESVKEHNLHVEAELTAAGFGPVREAREVAWDEGRAATFNDPVGVAFGDVTNPYREASS